MPFDAGVHIIKFCLIYISCSFHFDVWYKYRRSIFDLPTILKCGVVVIHLVNWTGIISARFKPLDKSTWFLFCVVDQSSGTWWHSFVSIWIYVDFWKLHHCLWGKSIKTLQSPISSGKCAKSHATCIFPENKLLSVWRQIMICLIVAWVVSRCCSSRKKCPRDPFFHVEI